MAALKNMRYEHYCREYIKTGGNGAEAYRRMNRRFPYKRAGITNPDSYRVMACYWQDYPQIQKRQQELMEIMAKKSDITIEKVLTDYQQALELAKMQEKPNDMINAATAQAKLVGLLRERVETGEVGDFDNLVNLSDMLEKIAQEAGPEVALKLSEAADALAKKLGVKTESEAGLAQAIPPSDSVN